MTLPRHPFLASRLPLRVVVVVGCVWQMVYAPAHWLFECHCDHPTAPHAATHPGLDSHCREAHRGEHVPHCVSDHFAPPATRTRLMSSACDPALADRDGAVSPDCETWVLRIPELRVAPARTPPPSSLPRAPPLV